MSFSEIYHAISSIQEPAKSGRYQKSNFSDNESQRIHADLNG